MLNKLVSTLVIACFLSIVIAQAGCNRSQTTLVTTPASINSACLCANTTNEWDAESCVNKYLITDAATTYNGKQVQAALADAYGYAYHGDCRGDADGSWEINVYFDPWVVDEVPALKNIFTQTSLCGPNSREAYNTGWLITPAGCIQAIDGNAIRLLAALQQ